MDSHRWLQHQDLQCLIDLLASDGFCVIGPTIDQHAILYDEITSVQQLPQGWTDSQSPGLYQIQKTPISPEKDKFFHYNLGPHSWKKYLFPPVSDLPVAIQPSESSPSQSSPSQSSTETLAHPKPQPLAILGARACELAAIAIQDRVLMNPPFVDPQYALRRSSLFVVAVQCTTAASTCFCTSMNTGPDLPNPESHPNAYDLALTELTDQHPNSHGFLIQAGSQAGRSVLGRLPTLPATLGMLEARNRSVHQVKESIRRAMPAGKLRDPLMAKLTHPHWDDVAKRCLSCANCTMVCPTCFCSSVDEVHDLLDDSILRKRRWDSCFNPDFSHTSGAPVRDSVRSRYRQWLTHKLATWYDQFDTSGCVGCGRCITWCPVGIDLTQEVAKLLEQNP